MSIPDILHNTNGNIFNKNDPVYKTLITNVVDAESPANSPTESRHFNNSSLSNELMFIKAYGDMLTRFFNIFEAEGSFLDILGGNWLNTPRLTGETDAQYKERIRATISTDRTTNNGIRKILNIFSNKVLIQEGLGGFGAVGRTYIEYFTETDTGYDTTTAIERVSRKGFEIQYTGSASFSSMTITDNGITITNEGGTDNISLNFIDQQTIQNVVNYINGQTNYTATVVSSQANTNSNRLININDQDIKTSIYNVNTMADATETVTAKTNLRFTVNDSSIFNVSDSIWHDDGTSVRNYIIKSINNNENRITIDSRGWDFETRNTTYNNGNPTVVTLNSHGFSTNDIITVNGATTNNGNLDSSTFPNLSSYAITRIDENSFSINVDNSSGSNGTFDIIRSYKSGLVSITGNGSGTLKKYSEASVMISYIGSISKGVLTVRVTIDNNEKTSNPIISGFILELLKRSVIAGTRVELIRA